MYYTGFADEAASDVAGQIAATQALGWENIESRNIPGGNLHDVPEDVFEKAADEFDAAGIRINCFGSAVANWACDPLKDEDFRKTREQLKRALTRMKRLNCKMIRGMSFVAQWKRPAFDPEIEKQVFCKVNELVRMCEEADVLYLHENCNNYGGMSWKHTLKLLENVQSPNFKLVFDTGNPVLNFDRSGGDALEKVQDAFVFYKNVREFIAYVHIKDAVFLENDPNGGFAKARFTFPGEGEGKVREIVTDLLKNGYDGGFSMEPHMVQVFHDSNMEEKNRERMENYIEYGKRFMKLVEEVKAKL